MSDIRDLLDRTARAAAAPPSAETIEADLQRGRVAMARRRRRRAIALPVASTLGLAVLAGATLVASDLANTDQTAVPKPGASAGTHQTSTTSTTSNTVGAPAIQLVTYQGEQLDGFLVEQVPDGWYLQGSSAARLTIAPKGDKTSPDDFRGKLVVMLQSADGPQALPDGEPVEVGEYDGVVTRNPTSDLLTYQDGQGRFVEVQATHKLGWSTQQLVRFAEGVTVTADAEAGVG